MADTTRASTALSTAKNTTVLHPTQPAYNKAAAGPSAVLSSLRYALKTSGVVRGARVFLQVNQKDGFDCPGCAWPDPEHRSVVEFCENGARAVTHEADARRVDATFFARHSIAELRTHSDHQLEHHGRLVEPMLLKPGASHYTPITWDDALGLVGQQLQALPSPDLASFYTSGRASNEAAFLYQLFARAYGTNNMPDCSNMCHESSGKGLVSTIGIGKGTVQLADFDQADMIFVIGQNPGTNHPRMLSTLQDAAKRGCTIVSVNPLKERALEVFAHPQKGLGILGQGTSISTHYLQIKINGDLAFLKGMMKRIFVRADADPTILDGAFLREHTTGLDTLRTDCDNTSWDEIVRISGLSRSAIEQIADIYCTKNRVIACWAMGITQHKNAVGTIRAIVNLLALRGNIGKPGAGVCPVRGHSNVQGDRTMGIWEAPSEAFLTRLEAGTGIRAPRRHGYDVVACIDAMARGDVRVFVALGGNFVAATPDTNATIAALGHCDLTVQISTKLNRSHLHGGKTSLILPCLGRTETDVSRTSHKRQFVTVENSMGVVHKSEGRLPPASDALRSEPWIVAELAHRTLQAPHSLPWRQWGDDYASLRDVIAKSIAGFADYNARVETPGGFLLDNGVRERRFNTETGKIPLLTTPLVALDVLAHELVLMTIRTHDQFNTTVYEQNDRYRGIYNNRRVVLMNADDVAARGLVNGQRVWLQSRFGQELRRVDDFNVHVYDIPKGCAAAYFPEANPLVPLKSVADESHTPTSKSVIITVNAA